MPDGGGGRHSGASLRGELRKTERNFSPDSGSCETLLSSLCPAGTPRVLVTETRAGRLRGQEACVAAGALARKSRSWPSVCASLSLSWWAWGAVWSYLQPWSGSAEASGPPVWAHAPLFRRLVCLCRSVRSCPLLPSCVQDSSPPGGGLLPGPHQSMPSSSLRPPRLPPSFSVPRSSCSSVPEGRGR